MSSDNKYVQYLYVGTSTADADFTNIANWEKTNLWEEVEPMLHHIEYEELTASQTVADKRMGTNGYISDSQGYDLLYFNVTVGKRYKINVAKNTLNQYSTVYAYYRDATRVYLPTGSKSCPVSNYEKVITAEYTQLIVSFDHGTSCKVYEEIEVPSVVSRVENLEESTIKTTDIVDNLTTEDPSKPLSAKQGKVLTQEISSAIGEIEGAIGGLNNLSTEVKTSLVNAINEVNNYLHTNSHAVINTLTNTALATGTYLSPGNLTGKYFLAVNSSYLYMRVMYFTITGGRKYTITVPRTGNKHIRVLAYSNAQVDGELQTGEYVDGKILSYIGNDSVNTIVLDSAEDYPYLAVCYDSRGAAPTVVEEYSEVIEGLIEKTDENTENIGNLDNLSTENKDSLVNAINEVGNKTEIVEISLPDKIWAVVGDTLQIFFRGCIKAVNPYNYNILVSCEKGNQYPRYFQYTPTISDIGTTSFKITIKDNNGIKLNEKECSLVTVSSGSAPSNQKNIVCFGDSLTANGKWCEEVYRRLTGSGGTPAGKEFANISFSGKYHRGDMGFFGAGGWDWSSYATVGRAAYRFQVTGVTSLSVGATYSNNGVSVTIMEVNVTDGTGNILCSYTGSGTPQASGTLTKTSGNGDSTITYTSYAQYSQNPLWDYQNNKMTFIPYANAYCNGQIDVVYTLLSWNGLTAWRKNFESIKVYMRTFADTLHTEFPNAKLKILGIQVNSVNGGMGANYGATGTSYADAYGMTVTALNQNKAYQDFANEDNYSDFVEFVNVSSQFDSEYNMPYTEVPVNTRCSVTEMRGTNGVHPSDDGYKQIADVVYRNIIKEICQ